MCRDGMQSILCLELPSPSGSVGSASDSYSVGPLIEARLV